MAPHLNDRVERSDHAQHRAQQSHHGADGMHSAEHAHIPPQLVGHAFTRVEDRLFDFDGRTPPFPHGRPEHLCHGAPFSSQSLHGFVSRELSGAKLLQEPAHKRPGNHPAPRAD